MVCYIRLCFLGHYMYIEASKPRASGEQARLNVRNLHSSQARCLTFYYNMYGTDMGTLSVWLRVNCLTTSSQVQWLTCGILIDIYTLTGG